MSLEEPNATSQRVFCDGGPAADDMTCPICLHAIDPLELATVKGCFHEYCACCILKWAACKTGPDPAWCPQCKAPFSYLYLHRQLDGTLSDYPMEESVCLLKVASWFTEHVREADKGKLLSGTSALAAMPGEEAYDDDYDYDYGDPEEDFYLTNGSGRARVVLCNRRLGENGFMRSGRMYARPVTTALAARSKGSNSRKPTPCNSSNGSSSKDNRASSSSGINISNGSSSKDNRASSISGINISNGSSSKDNRASSISGINISNGSSSKDNRASSSSGINISNGSSSKDNRASSSISNAAAATTEAAAAGGISNNGGGSGPAAMRNNSSGPGPSSASNNSNGANSSGKQQGRRAKRNARRAAYDLGNLDDECC